MKKSNIHRLKSPKHLRKHLIVLVKPTKLKYNLQSIPADSINTQKNPEIHPRALRSKISKINRNPENPSNHTHTILEKTSKKQIIFFGFWKFPRFCGCGCLDFLGFSDFLKFYFVLLGGVSLAFFGYLYCLLEHSVGYIWVLWVLLIRTIEDLSDF